MWCIFKVVGCVSSWVKDHTQRLFADRHTELHITSPRPALSCFKPVRVAKSVFRFFFVVETLAGRLVGALAEVFSWALDKKKSVAPGRLELHVQLPQNTRALVNPGFKGIHLPQQFSPVHAAGIKDPKRKTLDTNLWEFLWPNKRGDVFVFKWLWTISRVLMGNTQKTVNSVVCWLNAVELTHSWTWSQIQYLYFGLFKLCNIDCSFLLLTILLSGACPHGEGGGAVLTETWMRY